MPILIVMPMPPSNAAPNAGPDTARRRARQRLCGLLALGLLLSLLSTWGALTGNYEIGAGLRRLLLPIQVALFASLALQSFALTWIFTARIEAMPTRVALYTLLLATIAFLVFAQPFWVYYLQIATVMSFGLCAAFALCARVLARILPRGPRRVADIALFNVCAILLVGELALRAWHAISPSPLLAPTDSSTIARLDRYRQEPGALYLGTPVNSKGYYDEEFDAAGDGDARARIACIGDSFNVGVVPHELHYTSVAEREGEELRIDNYGIGGIGPSEYILLMRREVLATKPDAIVVSLFVGNDIAEAGKGRVGHRWLRSIFDRGNIRLYLLPRRLRRLAREHAMREGGAIAGVQGAESKAVRGLDKLRASFPWIEDPSLEKATFSEANFVEETTRRAMTVRATEKQHYARLEEDLREMQELCAQAGTKLFVILQAAEWQVEDDLWAKIHAKAGNSAALDRDAAQRLSKDILDRLGIPYVDVLDDLRAAAALPDGKKHVFHLRDTHYNARGNRIVGEALGRWLRSKLE